MNPVTVSITIQRPRAEIYDFLVPLRNHEAFTDHMLVDWSSPGELPPGVGEKARMRAKLPGVSTWVDMESIDAERPVRTVERSVSAKGKRVSRGTYTLVDAPGGGTVVSFEFAPERIPPLERLLAPLTLRTVRKNNVRALARLKTLLESAA